MGEREGVVKDLAEKLEKERRYMIYGSDICKI